MSNSKKNKNTKSANKNTAKPQNSASQAAENTKKTIQAAEEAVHTAVNSNQQNAENAIRNTTRLSAVDSLASSPDDLVHAGNAAVKDFMAASAEEAKKTQEKVLSMSKDNVTSLSNNAEKTTRSMSEVFSANQEQLDAVIESSKITSELCRDMQENFVAECNAMFNESVEISKDLLGCRTLNDFVEIQNRAVQNSMSHFFNQSASFADAWFKLATEASEPISTSASEVTNRLSKKIVA
ncbi:MAG: phasin family protein [Alphaproteobacteria bacterium]|nr:phasin family protein [Alphaproteobacteria bacterium]